MPELFSKGSIIEGRYKVENVLKGGMGVVYVCYDHKTGNPYAVKSLQYKFLKSKKARNDFKEEARTWVRLDIHNNVVKAEYVKEIASIPYIFLEYVTGGTLRNYIYMGMEIKQALDFAIQACRGLNYAYQKLGMIHRDIKPENILITKNRIAKVSDFGLAKAPQEIKENYKYKSRVGLILGTPQYMSPEQWITPKSVDTRSDIYSFGIILYEMFTGKYIYNAGARTTEKLLNSHLHRLPISPREINPKIPQSISMLINKCIEKKPEHRYNNFEEVLEKLIIIYKELTGKQLPIEDPPLDQNRLRITNKGISLSEMGKYEEAIKCFDIVLKKYPNDAYVLTNKGIDLLKRELFEEARECLDKAISVDSKYGFPWGVKGDLHLILGNFREALACFDHAISLEPNDPAFYRGKSKVLMATARDDEALACLNKAPKLNNDSLYMKGQLLDSLKRHDEAETCYDEILRCEPNNPDGLTGKAGALFRKGKKEEGLYYIEKALTINSNQMKAFIIKHHYTQTKFGEE